jgi:hypothetical protein
MTNDSQGNAPDHPADMTRRAVLQSAAGLAIGQIAMDASSASVAGNGTPGRPGEFDFLAGNWKISHRRLKGKDWDLFPGEATCWSILSGAGSIEELRIPARDFAGLGIRLLDAKQRAWSDYWINARSGVIVPPGTMGSFTNGVGTFISDDTDGGTAIKVRGVWDRITPTSCRWHQGVSRDGGKTWEDNWFMDWTRA